MHNLENEIYVSTDIEADGPIPGEYSMLSYASAAFNAGGTLISTFSSNLRTLPGAKQHPETMSFWKKYPTQYEATRTNVENPAESMERYSAWLKTLPGTLVFVGYPVGFDFTFITWYLNKFTGSNPFGFSALDVKSFGSGMYGIGYFGTLHKFHKPAPRDKSKLHVALDDAIAQGEYFHGLRVLSVVFSKDSNEE